MTVLRSAKSAPEQLGTVSKAATRLRIAQPALSRQIGAFEQELGLKLFDRVGAVFWDKRRPLPRYAVAFCEMLAEHVREVFPITRPGEPASKRGAAVPRTVTRRSARTASQ